MLQKLKSSHAQKERKIAHTQKNKYAHLLGARGKQKDANNKSEKRKKHAHTFTYTQEGGHTDESVCSSLYR